MSLERSTEFIAQGLQTALEGPQEKGDEMEIVKDVGEIGEKSDMDSAKQSSQFYPLFQIVTT